MSYWVMWLVVVVLLAIIEASTVNLVSIWFVISGLVALIVSLFTEAFYIQFGVFVLLGIILLVITKPAMNKMLKEKETKLNLERIIGINKIGEVKVDGKLWSAVSDVKIPVNSVVKAISMEGVKLVVEKVKTEKPKKKASTTSKKKSAGKKTVSKK